MRITESITDKFTLDYLRNQVLKNAYGNDDTFIAKLDPRTLLLWYGFFGVVPWFLNQLSVLIGLFLLVAVTTRIAKIAPLVLIIFCVGILPQTGYLLFVSFFFGGDITAVYPLLILTLKVAVVSLAAITVFSGLDPDRLATGLLFFGCPDQLSFSISFAYRIVPILLEEFQHLILSHRIRGKAPNRKGLFGNLKFISHHLKIIMLSFYPLMLNMAKRSRTTVEALELKGYHHAITNKTVKRLKLSMLKFTIRDAVFISASIIYVIGIFIINMHDAR